MNRIGFFIGLIFLCNTSFAQTTEPGTAMSAAQNDLAAARSNYDSLRDAALAKLSSSADFQAASAVVESDKKQVEADRNNGSPQAASLGSQYLADLNKLSEMKINVLSDPKIVAAQKKVAAATEALKMTIAESHAMADVQASQRPEGYSDQQWMVAAAAFKYRDECRSELEAARKELSEVPPDLSAARYVTDSSGHSYLEQVAHPEARGERESIQKRIDALESTSIAMQRGDVVVPPMKALTIGAAGHLDAMFMISQIVSGNEMIVQLPNSVDDSYWVSGTSTRGLIDDHIVELEGTFCISETHSYTTVMGSTRTIPCLEEIDSSNLKPAVDYLIYQSRHPTPTKSNN